jgi:hypothetical protein
MKEKPLSEQRNGKQQVQSILSRRSRKKGKGKSTIASGGHKVTEGL